MDTGPEDGETSEAAVEGGGGKWKETAAFSPASLWLKGGSVQRRGSPKCPPELLEAFPGLGRPSSG